MQADAVAWAQRTYEGRVSFVGISVHPDLDEVQEVVDKTGMDTFPHVVDTAAAAHLNITSHPTLIFYSADGTREKAPGVMRLDDFMETMKELVATNSSVAST